MEVGRRIPFRKGLDARLISHPRSKGLTLFFQETFKARVMRLHDTDVRPREIRSRRGMFIPGFHGFEPRAEVGNRPRVDWGVVRIGMWTQRFTMNIPDTRWRCGESDYPWGEYRLDHPYPMESMQAGRAPIWNHAGLSVLSRIPLKQKPGRFLRTQIGVWVA